MVRLMAILGVVWISFSGILVRLAQVSPTTAAFYRTVLAVPLLGVIWYWHEAPARSWRRRRLALLSGVLFAADLILFHHTIALIGAGLATVLGNLQVLVVGLMAWVIHRERPRPLALGMVPVIFVGVVLVSGLGRPEAYGVNPVLGAVVGVVTALAYSSYLLVFRSANPEDMPNSGPLLETTLVTALITLVYGLGVEAHFELTPSWRALGWLFVLAVSSQVIGWLLIGYALPRLPALETSILLLIQPLLTVLWGRIIFAEILSYLQWIGCALIIGGMAAVQLRGAVTSDNA